MKCLLAILMLSGALVQAAEKPNILFIAIDDMNDWTGFLGGHPQAQTPNMDKLAQKGVNFTNAHCPAPGCSPCRNALLFGTEPFHSGLYAFYDHAGFSDNVLKGCITIPELLRANGYNTYGSGKIHHRREPTPKEWTEFHKPEHHKLVYKPEEGYQIGNSKKMAFCPTANPLEEHPDYKVASYGVEVLSRKHEKPFFLAVGIVKPHLAFVCPQRFFDLYPKDVKPPRINPNDHDDIPAVGRAFAKISDDTKFKQDKAWTRVRRAYLACISWADYNVGRVLEALEASPYGDNTIVVLWSDHGYGQGDKRHFRKFALWEETTKVPFIIWDAREKKAVTGREVPDGVSLINIYRTLAEISGLEAPDYVDGFSLVPQLKNPQKPLPRPSICSWGRGNYTIRDRNWRYSRRQSSTEMAEAAGMTSNAVRVKERGYYTGYFGKNHVGFVDNLKISFDKMFDQWEFFKRSPYFKKMPDGSTRHTDELMGDRSVAFLKSRPQDKPFLLNMNFNISHSEDKDHRPGIGHYPWPKAEDGLYEDIVPPRPRLDDPEIYENLPEFFKASANRMRYEWRWDTPEKYTLNMRALYRMTTGMDRIVGRVLAELEKQGVADNTIVIYTADNGYYMGDRGLGGKWSHYEQSLRVPLIIYDPRMPADKRGRVLKPMASNLDLAPTMLEFAGVPVPATYQGRSLLSVLNGTVPDDWRTSVFCEHHELAIEPWAGIRDERYVYARYDRLDPPYEFLHDLKRDPDQLSNFVNDPEYSAVLNRFRDKTDSKIEEYSRPETIMLALGPVTETFAGDEDANRL